MIAFHYHRKARCAAGRMYNFGGDKQQNTTATTTTVDARQVNTTDINDLSQHNSNNTTASFDSSQTNSNNTTASFWTDSSGSNNQSNSNNTSAVFNTTTTDGGAIAGMANVALAAGTNALDQIKAAFGLASSIADGSNKATAGAYDYADGLFHASLQAIETTNTNAMNAWDKASAIETSALSQVQNAYADAKGTTEANQKTMLVMGGVAALAIVMMRKG